MLVRLLVTASLFYASLALGAEIVVVTPNAQAQAGERLIVSIYFTNASSSAESVAIPERLRARLHGAGATADAMLVIADAATAGTVALPPGGFRKVLYHAVVPDTLSGPVTLELAELAANAPMFAVVPRATVAAAGAPESDETAAAPSDPLRDSFNPQPALSRFGVHEPMYFAVGNRVRTNAKFQFSFRYRLVWDLNLGYTQTSLWDLQSDSKPFYDSAYKPRLFWFREDLGDRPDWLGRLGLEAGLGHESNGKDGLDSRSINIAYVQPRLTFGDPDGYHLLVAPRVFGYLEKTNNPDIADYRGYVDLTLKLGRADGLLLATELRRGTKGHSAAFDLSLPLRPITGDLVGGYLQLQYFRGHGESLLDYNRRLPPQFRIGYMLVR